MVYKYKEWGASKSPCGDWVVSDGGLIAREMRHWNAQLIVEAVNACIKLNPENPLAVAQSIEEVFEASEKMIAVLTLYGSEKPEPEFLELKQALAKANQHPS